MERFSGGLKKGGTAAATFKSSLAPAKGKFSLRTSRDPLPLVTKNQPSRETKPKAKFLTVAGAGASTKKQSKKDVDKAKLNSITTNSFIQPLTKDGAPLRKSSGFSFMKFQSKSRESGESTGKSVMKATPLALTGVKPFLGNFSAQPLAKKILCTTSKADNATLFKPQEKKGMLFAFRADTKSSVAKKRKTTESNAHKDGKTAFPCKNGRAKSILLENPVINKEKEKQAGAQVEKARRKDGIRSSAPFVIRMGEKSKKVDDGTMLKKRGLLSASAIAGPPVKKSKRVLPSAAAHPLQNTGVIESGSSSVDTCQSDRDQNVSLPRSCMLNPKETPLEFVDEPVNSVLSCAEIPLSPGKCGIEEELALKLVCTADDDKEDEFLARAAAIQEFTDRVGLEQKLICNRLLDAHADVSESLLDALTDLMAEEGGIGIDKLDFDLNIDVDVGDTFLQDDEIQVFQ